MGGTERKRTPQKGEARQAALVPRAFWNCHRRGFRPVALKYFSTVADSLPRTRTHPDHRAPHCLLFNRSFDRFITEARVIACPRLSHSRSLSTTRETTDAAIPEVDERERESFDERKERRDVTIALRFFVFHYLLVLFLHLFFFLFHAHCVVDARFYGSVLRGFQSRRDSASYLGFYFI